MPSAMTGPHYEYLTNQYVEAMDMEPWLCERLSAICVWVPELATKPASMTAWYWVVTYNHTLYFREHDGRAWSPWDAGSLLDSVRPKV